jgi:anaerobic selenocysteine-containing dehydrogenase
LVNHERAPGVGPLAGWRGSDGAKRGVGEPNPDQLTRYVENGCFWRHEFTPEQRYLKHANRSYLDEAHAMGWLAKPEPIVMQIYSETLQQFRLAARGAGTVQPPDALRARLEAHMDPLPYWTDTALDDGGDYPLHAVTQRPMQMYHSWGSQNAWLRQITARNVLYVHPETAAGSGLADGDWTWIVAPLGRVKAQIKCMAVLNRDTVWTWNAIGKRSRAWGLAADAPEARLGFLLNHLIPDMIPGEGAGGGANADPITGQAAWYDLRVRLEACRPDEAGETAPVFEPFQRSGEGGRPHTLRFGAEFDRSASEGNAKPVHREWIGNRAVYAARGIGIAPADTKEDDA